MPKIWGCFSTPKHPLVYGLDVNHITEMVLYSTAHTFNNRTANFVLSTVPINLKLWFNNLGSLAGSPITIAKKKELQKNYKSTLTHTGKL